MSVDDEQTNSDGNPATDSAEGLQRRAESALRKPVNLAPKQLSAMSPAAVQQALHDLQLHQIELEMQNEELRRVQAELGTSQKRYFDFYDLAPVGYCTVSESGHIQQANLTTASLLGVARDSLQGQSLARFILSDDQDVFYLLRQRAMGSHEPQDCELRMVHQTGAQKWLLVQALSAVGETGARHLRLVLSNITERRKTEADLVDSEHRYRTLVELTPEALVVHRNGIFVYVNPAAVKMFGAASASDLLGTAMLDRVHPDFHQIFLERVRHYSEHAGSAPMIQEMFLQLDGTMINVEAQGTAISWDGEPAIQVVMHDITERKAVEAALQAARLKSEAASQAKSRFLASASHDLRQPAHALGMFVARMAELPHDAQTTHLVACMDASVRAMQDMLDGFLDISRLDTEQTHVNRGAFPIAGVFDQLRAGLTAAAGDKGLRLRLRPSRAWIESDPGLLHRILLNLVNNAVRYTQHGSILVACRPTRGGTQLRIEVRDSGVGIAAPHHEEIFQEFFQIDNPQRDRSKGLGVGLSIVKRACRLLNHPLAMRSAPGCGTCFTVTVPLAAAPPGETSQDTGESTAQTSFDGLRVLLVEDDAMGRAGVADLLASWGCRVVTAEGAQAACDLYRLDQTPEIIISDYRLGGGINGIEAVGMLSAIAGRPVAACLISGDTDESVRQQAQAAGLTLLHKPVRPAKLRNLIRHLVQA